ncbi:hypothetical protein ACFQH6_02085 [Halobacteriaceae archaeon GCM10025711]
MEDAIPHETTVLVLNETETCFGRQPEELFDEVRSDLNCDKLLLEEHYRTLDDIPAFDKLIQYEIWMVHHSCLLVDGPTSLQSYLSTESFPDEIQVVVMLDTDDPNMVDYLRQMVTEEYSDRITVISSAEAMHYYLLGRLTTASPCTAAGLDYIVSLNNKISDNVGRHQDIE